MYLTASSETQSQKFKIQIKDIFYILLERDEDGGSSERAVKILDNTTKVQGDTRPLDSRGLLHMVCGLLTVCCKLSWDENEFSLTI